MSNKGCAAIVLCATAIAGCSTDSRNEILAPEVSFAQGGVAASAHGHGRLFFGSDELYRRFSFTALASLDGSAKGEYQFYSTVTDTRIHGDVDCLRVIGNNVAVISGVSERSSNPLFPAGIYYVFTVVDNGEGETLLPDMISLLTPAAPNQTCLNFSPAPMPTTEGNIQVRTH